MALVASLQYIGPHEWYHFKAESLLSYISFAHTCASISFFVNLASLSKPVITSALLVSNLVLGPLHILLD